MTPRIETNLIATTMLACLLSGGSAVRLQAATPVSHPPISLTGRVANTTLRLPPTAAQPLPPTLADTGAFTDLLTLTPAPGIVPFDLNVPLWSDGAHKARWFSIPNPADTIRFSREGRWSFPTGMVFVKHFEIELTNGVPESTRRLETRFMVMAGAQTYGITYRWDEAGTNAVLVPEEGADEDLDIRDGDTIRRQRWHYPSRAECMTCHRSGVGQVLGFNTAQLNRELDYTHGPENQIRALARAGYFDAPVTGLHTLRALAHPTNTAFSTEYRVRSYLAANCVHCHQPGGACSFTPFRPQITNTLARTGMINAVPLDNLGDPENRTIQPGDPDRSVLLQRIATRGAGQMPLLCTTVVDEQAVALLRQWITNDLVQPRHQGFADWQRMCFGSTNAPEAAAAADPDNDGAPNYLEYLTRRNPMDGSDPFAIAIEDTTAGGRRILFERAANRGFVVECTTHLSDPGSWQPLNVPDNRFLIPAEDGLAAVEDPDTNTPVKFYRVRVFEP